MSLKTVSTTVFTESWNAFAALVAILVSYSFAVVPFCYLLALYAITDSSPSSAVVFVLLINVISGFGFTIAYFILVQQQQAATSALSAIILQSMFSIFPAFNLGNGLIRICTNYYQNTIRGQEINFFSWDVTLTSIVINIFEGVFYFLVLLVLDDSPHSTTLASSTGSYRNGSYRFVDDDLLAEELRVMKIVHSMNQEHGKLFSLNHVNYELDGTITDTGDVEMTNQRSQLSLGEEYPLIIHQLCKVYPAKRTICCDVFGTEVKDFVALRGISLACRQGERLGLLGINGAGKTTTLSILTGEIQATSGQIYVGGKPLSDPQTMTMLGYCPQVDPLLELMNAYETLWFYGRIRGITTSVLHQRIESLITQTGLRPHAHRPSGTYSGGNKRKLSLAVALIGDPKVLLLDEPSTGMDPEARRQMWNVIQQVSAHRTVILVSHSMEEIEALCTRVAVLVGGQFRCLGSIPYLKSKYNADYEVSFRCYPHLMIDCVNECRKYLIPETHSPLIVAYTREGSNNDSKENILEGNIGDFVSIEEFLSVGLVRLRVGRNLDLPTAFAGFHYLTEEFGIEDLSITLGSLDSVFQKSMGADP